MDNTNHQPPPTDHQLPEATRARQALEALTCWDDLTDTDFNQLFALAERHPRLSPDTILRLYRGEDPNTLRR